ncbi:MAG TPA: hypothetical protein PKV73_02980 [Agriterribacter sp.]|nr:hypothetical protein [Agriterribacter sp.]
MNTFTDLKAYVIWGGVKKRFTPPEEMYNKEHVKWIIGKLVLYKGKPGIIIKSPDQFYDVVAAPTRYVN